MRIPARDGTQANLAIEESVEHRAAGSEAPD
jgi:hypothetical protein